MPSEQSEVETPRQQTPIGIEPRFIWLETRRDNLYSAVYRYRVALIAPPLEWLEELVDLEREIQHSQPRSK